MNLPRFRLPRRAHPRPGSGRHHHTGASRTATPTTPKTPRTAPRTPGPRAAVGGAMAVLAATAVAATAVTGLADAEPTSATTSDVPSTTALTDTSTDLGSTVVVSQDETTVRASSALKRAVDVTTDHASLTAKQERRIEAQVDEITEIMADRATVPASRSGERTALPATGDDTPSDTEQGDMQGDDGADDAAETGDTALDATDAEILAANRAAQESADAGTGTDAAADDVPVDTSGVEERAADLAADVELTAAEVTALEKATDTLVDLLDAAQNGAVDIAAAPETPVDITTAQAAAAKKAAAGLTKFVDSVADHANGEIPSDKLCELDFAPGETLRCDAAEQLERLDVAYHARFGEHLFVNDSYRSYAAQVATKASRGSFAAVPGYSNHGWGVAVDLNGGVETFGSARYTWLRQNAPKFGWDNPAWARADGRKPEAWHWEYTPLD